MPNLSYCLWFDHHAEEAAQFYCSLFHEEPPKRGKSAKTLSVPFTIAGKQFVALNPKNAFNILLRPPKVTI